MDISTYLYTDPGGRSNNEDFAEYEFTDDGVGIFVLADGLGGHDCGEIASRHAVKFTVQSFKENDDFSNEKMIRILNQSNDYILQKQREDEKSKNMRTTIVAAFTKDNILKYYNAGDSRFYYFKNGKLVKQSKDHSVSQVSVDLGEINLSQIRFNEDRNKLLKVLGNAEKLKIDSLDAPIVMESGDAFLLCSDGFWEYVYETEMEIDLLKSISTKQWIDFMVKRLLHRVTGDNDNFTVICSFVS
jgi:serine/threonine protein phosphatase PrpC